MYVTPRDQGQTVEVSYGVDGVNGWVYKKVYDRSDRCTEWYVADLAEVPEFFDESKPPPIDGAWVSCPEPDADAKQYCEVCESYMRKHERGEGHMVNVCPRCRQKLNARDVYTWDRWRTNLGVGCHH